MDAEVIIRYYQRYKLKSTVHDAVGCLKANMLLPKPLPGVYEEQPQPLSNTANKSYCELVLQE
jgi:hypothetical protein